VVIGAGVIGCAIALELARSGRSVIVVDKGPAAGAGSTSSSSAVIRYTYSTWDGVVTAWEAHFLWERWAEHLGIVDDAGLARFFRVGMLTLDAPGIDRARILRLFDAVGVPYVEWDAAAIRAHIPALDPARYWPPRLPSDPSFGQDPAGELAGFFTPDAGFVDDPQLAAHNLMHAARAHGASFRFGEHVVALSTRDGAVTGVDLAGAAHIAAPAVFNAAGPHSAVVNAMAGVGSDCTISTRPLRQEVHVARAPADFTVETAGSVIADGDLGTYFRPHPGGTILVGGVEAACDPLEWIDDPDRYDEHPSVDVWEAQTLRLARRIPAVEVPRQPRGLAALYDVSDDWIPIYDRTNLAGFFLAIGTSGNQFKNAPMAGLFMRALLDAHDAGRNHDDEPVTVRGPTTGLDINLAHYSRRRRPNPQSSNSVWG